MSIMHIAGGVVIGMLVGRLFSMFSLRTVKGGKYTYMLAGVVGSIAADLVFKLLYNRGYVSAFFYDQHIIVFEMIFGAMVGSYLLSRLGSKKDIGFE